MKKITKKLLALTLALVFVLAACTTGGDKGGSNGGSGKSGGEKILRTNNSSEPGSLDPALATGTHESWVMQHVYEGLMKYDESGKVVPGMAAEEPTLSEDGLTYTFKLRDGLKWSNGDPVTAKDFEYSWKRVLNPDTASDYAYQLYYVKGGEAYNTGKGSADDVAVKAIDEKTLEVTLETPTPYFVSLTAFYTLYPVNEKVVAGNADWAKNAESLVSNGPFKLESWEHNDKISIRKNADYYDADKVKLDGIDFDIIEEKNTEWQNYVANKYDLVYSPISNIVAKYLEEKNPELHSESDLATYYILYNTTEKPFTNAKVRQALSMAIDRQAIVDNVTKGGQTPATGLVPVGLMDDQGKDFAEQTGELLKTDPAAAKKLLEEGLKEEGMTIEDLNKKVLVYNTSEDHQKIMQAVQDMWKSNLGVQMGLENTEFQVLLDNRKQQNFDLCRAGWIGDYADPMTFLDMFMTGNGQNDGKYSNAEYDKLLTEAKKTADQKVRMDNMKQAEKILMDDMAIIPLYFYSKSYIVKPNVTGVYTTLTNYPFMTYADIQ